MIHISETLKKYFEAKIEELKQMQGKSLNSQDRNSFEESKAIGAAIEKMKELLDFLKKDKS